MSCYAGLDVSDKSTHICVVDNGGELLWQGVCATDPQVIADVLGKRCPDVVRVVLETGSLSSFLYHGLTERCVPVVCVCARHAKGVLSTRANKSDPNDAEGLAQLARTGWFKAVHIKDSATHLDRTHLKGSRTAGEGASSDAQPDARAVEAIWSAARQGDHAGQACRAAA